MTSKLNRPTILDWNADELENLSEAVCKQFNIDNPKELLSELLIAQKQVSGAIFENDHLRVVKKEEFDNIVKSYGKAIDIIEGITEKRGRAKYYLPIDDYEFAQASTSSPNFIPSGYSAVDCHNQIINYLREQKHLIEKIPNTQRAGRKPILEANPEVAITFGHIRKFWVDTGRKFGQTWKHEENNYWASREICEDLKQYFSYTEDYTTEIHPGGPATAFTHCILKTLNPSMTINQHRTLWKT